jgi:hypothetical protein
MSCSVQRMVDYNELFKAPRTLCSEAAMSNVRANRPA